jgi:AT hook motif
MTTSIRESAKRGDVYSQLQERKQAVATWQAKVQACGEEEASLKGELVKVQHELEQAQKGLHRAHNLVRLTLEEIKKKADEELLAYAQEPAHISSSDIHRPELVPPSASAPSQSKTLAAASHRDANDPKPHRKKRIIVDVDEDNDNEDFDDKDDKSSSDEEDDDESDESDEVEEEEEEKKRKVQPRKRGRPRKHQDLEGEMSSRDQVTQAIKNFIRDRLHAVQRIFILQDGKRMQDPNQIIKCLRSPGGVAQMTDEDRKRLGLPSGVKGTKDRMGKQNFTVVFHHVQISGKMIELDTECVNYEDPRDCGEIINKLEEEYSKYSSVD